MYTARHPAARVAGALLCLAVAAIHVADQGGVPGETDVAYVHYLYLALELGAVICVVLLLAGAVRPGWALAVAVAAAPLIGYILSRGPGLPSYTEDKGNWTEPLGVASLAVEAVLLVLSLAMLRSRPAPAPAGQRFRRVPADEREREPVCY